MNKLLILLVIVVVAFVEASPSSTREKPKKGEAGIRAKLASLKSITSASANGRQRVPESKVLSTAGELINSMNQFRNIDVALRFEAGIYLDQIYESYLRFDDNLRGQFVGFNSGHASFVKAQEGRLVDLIPVVESLLATFEKQTGDPAAVPSVRITELWAKLTDLLEQFLKYKLPVQPDWTDRTLKIHEKIRALEVPVRDQEEIPGVKAMLASAEKAKDAVFSADSGKFENSLRLCNVIATGYSQKSPGDQVKHMALFQRTWPTLKEAWTTVYNRYKFSLDQLQHLLVVVRFARAEKLQGFEDGVDATEWSRNLCPHCKSRVTKAIWRGALIDHCGLVFGCRCITLQNSMIVKTRETNLDLPALKEQWDLLMDASVELTLKLNSI